MNLAQKAFILHANIYKAMANAKRLEVINLLRDRELTVTEMAQMLAIRQANLSQHLSVLRQAGIVASKRNGINIYYRLVSTKIVKAQDLIREVLLKQLADKDKELVKSDLQQAFEVHVDPVCQMHINAFTASSKTRYKGETIYFCGRGCKTKFIKQPQEFDR